MINFLNISRRLKYLFGTIALSWVLFFLLRVAFFRIFYESSSLIDILKSFWVGLRFDLRLSILTALPSLLLCVIASIKYWKFSYSIYLIKWIYPSILSLIVLFYTFDFATYSYTQQRIDITVFTLLENFAISAGMMWESYPIVWLFLLVVLICSGCIFIHCFLIKITLNRNKFFRKIY